MVQQHVVDNPSKSRFELDIGGYTAFVEYRLVHDRIVLTHTEVPEALGGRGIGSQLARGVYEFLRQHNRKATAECTFMAAFGAKHPELAASLAS